MAKIDLKFLDTEEPYTSISVGNYENREISIEIKDTINGVVPIYLDIPTAIKFAKTLRTEINKVKEVQDDTL